ncbi:MAG: CBS domain-containing protein [bacterium]|nr:CBS domain-containing protein [bacterium]
MRVRDLMTKNVVPISLDEQLDLVNEIMKEGNIRHMPVTKGGRVVGIVSQRDLLRARLSSIAEYSQDEEAQFLQGVDVEQIMTSKVKVADPDELVVDAARRMIEAKIGCLPVVDKEGDLIGLITETDIIRHYVEITGKGKK